MRLKVVVGSMFLIALSSPCYALDGSEMVDYQKQLESKTLTELSAEIGLLAGETHTACIIPAEMVGTMGTLSTAAATLPAVSRFFANRLRVTFGGFPLNGGYKWAKAMFVPTEILADETLGKDSACSKVWQKISATLDEIRKRN